MRVAAAWSGEGFIDYNGINFNDRHGVHPRIVGEVLFENPTGPGWANPVDGRFVDSRTLGRDGRQYGPLPRDWAHYRGMYAHGQDTVIAYIGCRRNGSAGNAGAGETVGNVSAVVVRHMVIGAHVERDLTLQVAHRDDTVRVCEDSTISVATRTFIAVASARMILERYRLSELVARDRRRRQTDWHLEKSTDGDVRLTLPASDERERRFARSIMPESTMRASAATFVRSVEPERHAHFDLTRYKLTGGPRRWPEVLTTACRDEMTTTAPFAVDTLTRPS